MGETLVAMRSRFELTFVVIIAALSPACGGGARPAQQAPRARLVVSVVLDQIGSEVLERDLAALNPHGLIRQTIALGAYVPRSVYPYAATYTAPGHATIYSGVTPSVHGIVANKIWDRARRRIVSVVDDAEHAVHGNEGAFAAPGALLNETVADSLKRASHGRSRVVSISLKDRCAVIPGGAHPDASVWYDERAQRFVTSSYYDAAMPPWLVAFATSHPLEHYFGTWTLRDAREGRDVRDDRAGEGDWHGLGTTFPHVLASSTDPAAAFLATPFSAHYLIDLADAAVSQFALGNDDAPDLLAISISSTDYAGHVFGPDSLESLDTLIRVDEALSQFVQRLERRMPVAVLITADHGVVSLPEISRAGGHAAERLQGDELQRELDAHLVSKFGEGPWVDAFQQPFVYLSALANGSERREAVIAEAIAKLGTLAGVHAAYDARRRDVLARSSDGVEQAVANSIHARASGDIFVVPSQRSIVDELMPVGFGTSHGSPWPYDTTVPVIVRGPEVRHVRIEQSTSQLAVAPTLAQLLHVAAPRGSTEHALPVFR